jgi:hypothetical protein
MLHSLKYSKSFNNRLLAFREKNLSLKMFD